MVSWWLELLYIPFKNINILPDTFVLFLISSYFFGFSQRTNAEKFIEENQKRQLAKLEKRQEERWNNLSLHIEKEIKENFNSGIKRLENFLQTCSVKSVRFTAEMVGLDTCFKLWMECCLKPGM